MSAITAALSQIDRVAAEGDLVPDPAAPLELETAGEPILLPDGKRIYPPCLHGQPIDELALALLDMEDPAQSTFLRLIGPPGAGKSQIARAIAYRLWTGRGREVADRHGAPFYGFVELQPGPSSDEFFFRYDYVPVAGAGAQVKLVDSAFVQAMREGWVVMIDEVNTARDVALLSINATLDGRLSLYLAATGETVMPSPGSPCCSPTTRDSSARPTSPTRGTRGSPRRSRSPATGRRSPSSARRTPLVTEAMRLDRQRIAGEDGLGVDAAVPRRRIAVADERAGRRARRARVLRLQPPRAGQRRQDPGRRGGGRLPDARPGRLRTAARLGHQRPAEPARLPTGGHLMTPASRTPASTGVVRAAAAPRRRAARAPRPRSTRTCPTTGRRSSSACTRCGR